jgi:hypothetical protein
MVPSFNGEGIQVTAGTACTLCTTGPSWTL